jgi:hypothetical protein
MRMETLLDLRFFGKAKEAGPFGDEHAYTDDYLDTSIIIIMMAFFARTLELLWVLLKV